MSKKKETTSLQIDSLLNKLQPGLRTKKKEALEDFSIFFFIKRHDGPTEKELFKLFVGDTKRIGLLAVCGNMSKRTGNLQRAADAALCLLARIMDPTRNAKDWRLFRRVFLGLDASYYKLIDLDTHKKDGNADTKLARAAIQDMIKDPEKALLEPDKASTSPWQQSRTSVTSLSSRAKDWAEHTNEKGVRYYFCEAIQTTQWEKPPNFPYSSPGSAPDAQEPKETEEERKPTAVIRMNSAAHLGIQDQKRLRERQNIKDRLNAFFGNRKPPEELVKKGLLKRGSTFGVELADLASTKGVNGVQYVPNIVTQLVAHMHPEIAKIEGLFRISGDSLEIQNLKRFYDFEIQEQPDLSKYGPHTTSGVFKLFLRELPEPLLTFGAYAPLLAAVRAGKLAECDQIVAGLPPANLATWNALLDFLVHVGSFSRTNMMTAKNLAIVFAPNILRLKVETFASIAQDTPVLVGLLEHFILERAKLLGVPMQEKTGVESMRTGNMVPIQAARSTSAPTQKIVTASSPVLPATLPSIVDDDDTPPGFASSMTASSPVLPATLPRNVDDDDIPPRFASSMTTMSPITTIPEPRAQSASGPSTSTSSSSPSSTASAPSPGPALPAATHTPSTPSPGSPWKEFFDATRSLPYYHNELTQKTIWIKPLDF